MTDTVAFDIRFARIITPTMTWAKYAVAVTPDGLAIVRHPRDTKPSATLDNVQVFTNPDGTFRFEGNNAAGEREVWKVDNLGCGCRDATHEYPTAMEDIPT